MAVNAAKQEYMEKLYRDVLRQLDRAKKDYLSNSTDPRTKTPRIGETVCLTTHVMWIPDGRIRGLDQGEVEQVRADLQEFRAFLQKRNPRVSLTEPSFYWTRDNQDKCKPLYLVPWMLLSEDFVPYPNAPRKQQERSRERSSERYLPPRKKPYYPPLELQTERRRSPPPPPPPQRRRSPPRHAPYHKPTVPSRPAPLPLPQIRNPVREGRSAIIPTLPPPPTTKSEQAARTSTVVEDIDDDPFNLAFEEPDYPEELKELLGN